MYKITKQEQVALIIGFSLIILIIIVSLFSLDFSTSLLFLGGTTVFISLIIAYIFVIQPMKGQIPHSPYNRYSTPQSPSFRLTIIPPSKTVKKTVMKGSCEYCRKKELMGFTCSYCSNYFCAEHRLPEKHDCMGIRRS